MTNPPQEYGMAVAGPRTDVMPVGEAWESTPSGIAAALAVIATSAVAVGTAVVAFL